MPFLLLPRSRAPSSGLLDRLAERLCPYRGRLEKRLETARYELWGTSLTVARAGEVRPALAGGTASFVVERDDETLRFHTDALGTCPIWFAQSAEGAYVSPEAKAIALLRPVALQPDEVLLHAGPRAANWSPFEGVSRLAPGCTLELDGRRAVPLGAPAPIVAGSEAPPDGDWARLVGETLVGSFEHREVSTGALVSGGIDSAVACALARRHGPVRTFSLGTRWGDEFDASAALATRLETTHETVRLERAEVLPTLDRVIFENEVFDGLTAEILTQLRALYRAARGRCERVTTGYGSDLLFDGMLRVPAYLEAVGLETTVELIERTRWTGELAPFLHWSEGIAAEHVFWHPRVMRTALSIPRELCFVEGVEKRPLREGAVKVGLLPEDLAFRSKIGLSAGTGANRLLSEALELPDSFSYRDKSRACIERLRRVLAT